MKRARGAAILAHNYQAPEIFHGVADITGDSLALAQAATSVDADIIVLCGVHFMAETAKLLNPDKVVLIPDARAGCSLAESITAADVRRLRERHPGVPVVTYVNTSAAVKAESDICCTSANAVEVVESLGADRVIFLPDEYLGKYVAGQTAVELILWNGHCEVHERFRASDLRAYRQADPGGAHPGAPRMFPRSHRRSRLRGVNSRHGLGCRGAPSRPRRHDHRMFHERQRRRSVSRHRIRPPLQPLSTYEANHARGNLTEPAPYDDAGARRQ
jgi:hypothetical protein